MLFGDHVTPAVTGEPAGWIDGACRGTGWTVGALVPNGYPVVLRVRPPDPGLEHWWSAYRDLYEVVASIGERHTTSPHRAWFAVWEGHGFATATTHVAGSAVDRTRGLDEGGPTAADRRNGRPRRTARDPTFELPHRRYYLLTGPVSAVTQLRYPPPTNEWRNPDLFWPDDRRWFVATDVDFWSLYIGGDDDFIGALASNVPTPSEIVGFDRPLEIED